MSPISMKFHSFTLFLALLLYFSHYANGEDECISCASSIFASEWQVTGFPIHPPRSIEYTYTKGTPVKVKSFAFTDQCDKKYDESTNKLPRTPCSGGICIEMLLLANGVYGIVRGCLADFYLSSKQPPFGKEQCIMGKQNQNTTIWEGDQPNPIPQTSVGFSTCKTTGDIPCNNILEAKLNFALGTRKKDDKDTNSAWSRNCEEMAGSVECLECQRYDMEGTCNWDVRKYCNGGWCTKTIGYVNGRWLEVRGCAPINPLNSQTCFKIDKTTQFPLLADVDVPRTVSIEHCMCATQKCNGAMKMAGKIIPIELLLILVISISIIALKLN